MIKIDQKILDLIREEHLKNYSIRESSIYVNEHFNEDLIIAEVGSRSGINAKTILLSMKVEKLYLIDPYTPYLDGGTFLTQEDQDAYYVEMYNNMKQFLDRVIFITRPSILASKLFEDEYFDYIYLDANHNYESVMTDQKSWFPKVKKGGFISGHDIGYPDVIKAVNDFIEGYNYHQHTNIKPMLFTGDWLYKKE